MSRKVVKASLGVATTILFVLLNLFSLDYWITSSPIRSQQLNSITTTRHCSSDFQVIENGSAFVYSAYVDDRPARDFVKDPDSEAAVVRVLTYFLRTMDVQRRWKCLLWYADRDEPIVVEISAVTNMNREETELRFVVAMVLCDLPKTPLSSYLRGVSIYSSSFNAPNFVCVVDLRRMRSVTSQQSDSANFTLANNQTRANAVPFPSNNETAEKEDPRHQDYKVTFTVCTSPIHGNHYTVSDIVHFIEVNRILGAEKFIFHVDENLLLTLRQCLESYAERGLVEMYAFTPPVLDGLHYHGQIVAITDCVYRTMYRTKYLINKDVDEVIVPAKVKDWQTLLDDIHVRVGPESADRIAVYSFRNQFFPLGAADDAVYSQRFLVRRYNIKTLLKTLKSSSILNHQHRSKVMARPERVLIWHVHLIREENLVREHDTIYEASPSEGLLHHYREWDTSDNLTVEHRMHEYGDLLTEKIHFGMAFCLPIF